MHFPRSLSLSLPVAHPALASPDWHRRRFIAALGAVAAAPAAAQFRVEISGVGATQVPVVVADFRGEESGGVPLAAVIRADLERSGLFRASPAGQPLDEGGRRR